MERETIGIFLVIVSSFVIGLCTGLILAIMEQWIRENRT